MRTSAPTLHERERELAQLAEAIAAAAAGRGVAIAVVGTAGIGKTSLLSAARALAEQRGVCVAAARGGEFERDFPYGVARNLLEPALHRLTRGERRAVFEGSARLAAPLLGQTAGEAPDAPDSPFAVVHALYWVCVNLSARRPAMFVVDDVHWADAASLRFLAYLVRRVEGLPLLVLTARRPVTGAPDAELLDAMTVAREVRRLELGPLSEAAVAAIMAARLGGQVDRDLLRIGWEATGGNPFLCETLASAIADSGLAAPPEELVDAAARESSSLVVARLGRLPAGAQALARAVAILGSDAELRHAARLSGLADGEAAAAADALTAHGVLSVGRPLEFVHPLVRTAVRESIPAAHGSLAHARAARVLHEAGASEAAVAAHLLAAEPAADPWTVGVLRGAAGAAMKRGAPENAAACLRRALREPPAPDDRAHLLAELGAAELVLGNPDEAADRLEQALGHTGDPLLRGALARQLASAHSIAGRYEAAVAALDRALAELRDREPEAVLALESQRFLHAVMAPRDPAGTPPRLRRVAKEVRGGTSGERAYLAALATSALLLLDRAHHLHDWGTRLLDGGIAADLTGSGAIWHPVAYALTFGDEFELAERMVDEGLQEARRRGSAVGAARAYQSRAVLRLRQGDLREAVVDARVAIDTGAEVGLAGRVVATAVLIDALRELGALEEAQAALVDAGLDGDLPLHFLANFALHARGWLRLAQARHAEAVADFEQLDRRGRRWHAWNPGMFAYRSGLALALSRGGDDGRRRRLARQELALARRWRAARTVGIALRTVGLVEGGAGGVTLLRESVETLAPSEAVLEHARSLVELGAAIRRAGTPAAAREPLAAGMELAHRCGAVPLVERARHELLVTGARPRRIVRSGVDALTPSELRVARLAAGGRSNREIAQMLFVTLRTVEVHLTHAYQKLDIAGREQLPAALAVP